MNEQTTTDIETVHALLDELAPPCIAKNNPGRIPCPNVAEWIVTTVCPCGSACGSKPHCSAHLQDGLAGRMNPGDPAHTPHGHVIVVSVERLRSKP